MRRNMGKKIALSLILLAVIFLLFVSFAYIALSNIAADVGEIRLAEERALLALRTELAYTGAVLQIRRYLADGLPGYRETALRGYSDVLQQEQRLLELSPARSRDMVETVIQKTQTYVTGVTGKYLPLHEEEKRARAAGNIARADGLAVENRAQLTAFTWQAEGIQTGLRAISAQNEAIISAKLASVVKVGEELLQAVWLLSLLSLLVAVTLGYRLTKSITGPLHAMTRSMDEMAAGSFDHDTSPALVARDDEFGLMAKSLTAMKENTGNLLRELHENQDQMRALLAANPDLIVRFSGEGHYLEIVEPTGWNSFNTNWIRVGGNLSEALPGHLAALFMGAIRRTLETDRPQTFEYQVDDRGGQWTRDCRTFKKAENEVVFIIRDITDRRKVEETLRQIVEGMSGSTGQEFFDYLTDYFAKTFNVRYCFIGEFLGHGKISLLSSMVRGARLNPFSFEVEADQPSHEIYHGNDVIYREKIWQDYPFFRNIQGSVADEADAGDAAGESGSRLMESYIGVSLKAASGQVLGIMALMDERPVPNAELIIAIFRIFAARVAAELERLVNERKIQQMAYNDALTGLPNRWRSNQLLDGVLAEAREYPGTVATLRFDIDNFRYVNDSIGRSAGDKLFVAAVQRLGRAIGDVCPNCDIARLDGDNFLVIIKNCDARAVSAEVAKAMIDALTQSFRCGERDIYLNTSIGISLFPQHGETGDELLKNAERALNYAKEYSKGSTQYYDPNLQTEAMKKIALLNDMRNAITNEEFVLYYQPQYTPDKRLVGVEALLRWKSPQKGMVAPLDFIPLAEASGLIIPIGEWVLNQACRQLKSWLDDGAEPLRVAVNISAVQFNQPRFVDMVRLAVETSGIPADLIELEITENVAMHGIDKVRDKLDELAALGVFISIDDFGTGYSSLSYLQTFPIYSLKIDRSFVRSLHTNQANADIVSAIIALAHSLSLKVVAEGVEKKEELDILKEKGCDIIQGYLFGYPQPVESLSIPKRRD